jgi:hypothetical protein
MWSESVKVGGSTLPNDYVGGRGGGGPPLVHTQMSLIDPLWV